MLYDWVRALHIIFVIALRAGLLVYPRYKIHQLASQPGEALFETMRDASARLVRIILTPSLVLAWLLGLVMLSLNPLLLSFGWMQVKLALLLILSGLAGWFIGVGRKIDTGASPVEARTLRMMNEVPFLITIAVVILAVVEPFTGWGR